MNGCHLVRQGFFRLACMIVALVFVVTGAAADTPAWIRGATSNKVHLRLQPGADSESLGLYFTGTPVEVIRELANGWSQVMIGTEAGYVRTDLLSSAPVTIEAPVYEV